MTLSFLRKRNFILSCFFFPFIFISYLFPCFKLDYTVSFSFRNPNLSFSSISSSFFVIIFFCTFISYLFPRFKLDYTVFFFLNPNLAFSSCFLSLYVVHLSFLFYLLFQGFKSDDTVRFCVPNLAFCSTLPSLLFSLKISDFVMQCFIRFYLLLSNHLIIFSSIFPFSVI